MITLPSLSVSEGSGLHTADVYWGPTTTKVGFRIVPFGTTAELEVIVNDVVVARVKDASSYYY